MEHETKGRNRRVGVDSDLVAVVANKLVVAAVLHSHVQLATSAHGGKGGTCTPIFGLRMIFHIYR
eukprot:COSAG05_NODE_1020_length_6147_cov_4.104828_3_plen_65_part_00